jgi:hypothetical protein
VYEGSTFVHFTRDSCKDNIMETQRRKIQSARNGLKRGHHRLVRVPRLYGPYRMQFKIELFVGSERIGTGCIVDRKDASLAQYYSALGRAR